MTDYEKLKGIIDEIDDLTANHVIASAAKFKAWQTKTERFLIKKYGADSLEHKNFMDVRFSPMVWFWDDEEQAHRDAIEECHNGLLSCKAVFKVYLEELEDEGEPAVNTQPVQPVDMSKIFIVHGHDGELKQHVARIVEKQGIEAVILSEQVNQGRTIVEKFETNSDVGGAICLFTADDVGKAKDASTHSPRARQNVVLETGYFMGKLGRDHVVILADEGIEIPSDLSGVVYTSTSNWKIDLLKELRAMGYAVDFNRLF